MSETTVILSITAITVGARWREEYGDLDGLAASIARYGLMHPIVVDDEYRLIAGGRRLQAFKMLGRTEIPTRLYGSLTPLEKREMELEENARRDDLTAYERSKALVSLADLAAEVDRETRTESVQVSRGSRGPAQEPGSLRRVSERIGIPTPTINLAQQHVAAVEEFPDLAPAPQKTAVREATNRRQTDDDKARAEQWKKHDIVHTCMGRMNVLRQIDADAYVARLGGLTALTVFLENDLEIAEASIEWLRAYAAALRVRLGVTGQKGLRAL